MHLLLVVHDGERVFEHTRLCGHVERKLRCLLVLVLQAQVVDLFCHALDAHERHCVVDDVVGHFFASP
jgi:hypothetical protein